MAATGKKKTGRSGFGLSARLRSLPPYLFAEIDRQKGELAKKGISFIDLSIGDPDIEAPGKAIDVLARAAREKQNQKYALDQGKPELRNAIKKWCKGRFDVVLDAEEEILPLIGSKEGLVHLPLAFVDSGDVVIIPSPGYPGYRGAAVCAGAEPYELPLREENGFLPDLEEIPLPVRNKAKMIYVNYPNNPATVLAPREWLEKLVGFCTKYGIILAYDNAYSEIFFDRKPLSVLEVSGAREVALEFHSFSKTFCMTGFRIGWACGNSGLVGGLGIVKKNVDSGIFGAVQDTAAYCLENESEYVDGLRSAFERRRQFFCQGLLEKGFKKYWADSTFYVWAKIPEGRGSSLEYAAELLSRGVVATPGTGFGRYGEGYIRFALTVGEAGLKEALDRIEK